MKNPKKNRTPTSVSLSCKIKECAWLQRLPTSASTGSCCEMIELVNKISQCQETRRFSLWHQLCCITARCHTAIRQMLSKRLHMTLELKLPECLWLWALKWDAQSAEANILTEWSGTHFLPVLLYSEGRAYGLLWNSVYASHSPNDNILQISYIQLCNKKKISLTSWSNLIHFKAF